MKIFISSVQKELAAERKALAGYLAGDPLLRRFFLRARERDEEGRRGVTLVIDYPEKIIPAADDAGTSQDERKALVTLLKLVKLLVLLPHNQSVSLVRN